MTIDERVTAFMEARGFALIPHGRFFKPGSAESRESDWLVVARDARFMYRLHLESMLLGYKDALYDSGYGMRGSPKLGSVENKIDKIENLIAETQ